MTDVADPPGWYADPTGRAAFRWWDGATWTAYAADKEVHWDEVPGGDAVEPTPPAPRGVGIAFIGYFGGVALALAIAAVLRAVDRPGGRIVELCASQLGLWAGLIGACVYVSRTRGTGSLARDFGWRMEKLDVGLGLAGSLVARVIAAIAVAPVAVWFRDVRVPDRSVFDKVANDGPGWTVLVIIVCIGAPLVEELFFRGLLQTGLVEALGAARGIGVTAVLFGAAHLTAWQGNITFLYGLGIAAAGLVLGLMRHTSNRLGPSTWAHAFFNAQAMIAVALLT